MAMKRILWYLLAGTKGGASRARIIMLLRDRPFQAAVLLWAIAALVIVYCGPALDGWLKKALQGAAP